MRSLILLAAFSLGLVGCISTRQPLTPEASRVAYTEDAKLEPTCDMVEELTVGRDYFVTDERQPAVSKDDVVVRFRRLAAKKGGNYVVILENEPPNNNCTGYNGLGRIYPLLGFSPGVVAQEHASHRHRESVAGATSRRRRRRATRRPSGRSWRRIR